jgi:uncharacterized protein involved in exopolysaccharide biosynthesis
MNGRPSDLAAPARRISTRDFAAVLFRRKWVIGGVFIITTLVTAVMILSQPTVYESTGKVLLKRGVKDNLYESSQRTLSWEEDLASEIETARSATVIAQAQRMLDRARQAEGRPRFVINPVAAGAAVVGESNVLAISYQNSRPAVCVEVTQALLTAYTDYRRNAYNVPYPAEFFDTEIRRVRATLDALQNERRDLLAQGELVDGSVSDRVHLLGVKTSAEGLYEVRAQELVQMREQLRQMRRYLADPVHSPDVPFLTSTGSGTEMGIFEYKKELMRAEVELSELSTIYHQDVPELVRLRKHVADLRVMLDHEVRNRIRLAEQQLEVKEAEVANVRGQLDEANSRVGMLPIQEARIADLDRRIDVQKENYRQLMERSEQARIQQATSPRWTVLLLSAASAPYAKNTKDYVRIALAPVFSLIVGLGLAFFVDSLDTSVKNPREVEEALELPVLATLTERRRRR